MGNSESVQKDPHTQKDSHSEKCLYRILGAKKGDCWKRIRDRYRCLIKKCNPHSENFVAINRAYYVLSEFGSREKYDKTGEYETRISEMDLTQLACEGHFEELKSRLESTPSLKTLNGVNIKKQTPLYCASRSGLLHIVQYLVEHGADPDIVQVTGSTSLHVSAFYGHKKVVEYLLKRGANIYIKNSFDRTPMEDACNDEIEQLFKEMENDPWIQASSGRTEFFKKHLKKHIDSQNDLGQTVLYLAAKKGHIELVKYLIIERNACHSISDNNYSTPLHVASYYGRDVVVDFLLEMGANPNEFNKWGSTPEMEGMVHPKVVKAYIKQREKNMWEQAEKGNIIWFWNFFHHTKKSIDQRNHLGETVLHKACSLSHQNSQELVRWILSNNANINAKDNNNNTPLHIATAADNRSIVRILLEKGAKTNMKNRMGKIPREIAQSMSRMSNLFQVFEEYSKVYEVHSSTQTRDIYDLHVYDGNVENETMEPYFDRTIGIDTTFQEIGGTKNHHFLVSGIIIKKSDDPSQKVLQNVCDSVKCQSGLITVPLTIVRYRKDTTPKVGWDLKASIPTPNLLSYWTETILKKVTLKLNAKKEESVTLGEMQLIFPEGCLERDTDIEIVYYDPQKLRTDINCKAIFRLKKLSDNQSRFSRSNCPVVKYQRHNESLELYISEDALCIWFKQTQFKLRSLNGMYMLIEKEEIIPKHLSLHKKLLCPCKSPSSSSKKTIRIDLLTGETFNPNEWETAYHGTSIENVESIVNNGLVIPDTRIISGKMVKIPNNHISRGTECFGIADFARAVFVSPSISYSSDPCYSKQFNHDGKLYIPVLEVKVRKGTFSKNKSTTPSYKPKENDPIDLEYRIDNPTNIHIVAILLILKNEKTNSEKARSERTKATGMK